VRWPPKGEVCDREQDAEQGDDGQDRSYRDCCDHTEDDQDHRRRKSREKAE
jgi:hypothetical protein